MRLLILPALFDEANKLRRFSTTVMRGLDSEGIDSFLPDLPGWNESLAPLDQQSVRMWQDCATAAAYHFGATHVLTLRGSAMVAPPYLPGWQYAPQTLASALNQMVRARIIASRERGVTETRSKLIARGCEDGLTVCGYRLNAAMVQAMAAGSTPTPSRQLVISHQDVGGQPLWLCAEPQEGLVEANGLVRAILGHGAA